MKIDLCTCQAILLKNVKRVLMTVNLEIDENAKYYIMDVDDLDDIVKMTKLEPNKTIV